MTPACEGPGHVRGAGGGRTPLRPRPAIEAIPYMQVKTVSDAAGLVGESSGGIIIDLLHLKRGGGTPGDVRSLDPMLIAYFQLFDTPPRLKAGDSSYYAEGSSR